MPYNKDEDDIDRSNPLFVGTLEKGLNILRVFRETSQPISMTEICAISGMGKSSVQRFCHTFTNLGYITKNPRSKLYSPTPLMLEFAFMYINSDRLIQIATPYLTEAREKTGQALNLARRVGTDVIYTVRLPSSQSRISSPILGNRAPVFCTASGRAILSALSPEKARSILKRNNLEKLTNNTIIDTEQIMNIINQCKHDGYTIAEQECIQGEMTIAAPIISKDRDVLGAINIATTAFEFDREKIQKELAPIIMQTALNISRAIGLSPYA